MHTEINLQDSEVHDRNRDQDFENSIWRGLETKTQVFRNPSLLIYQSYKPKQNINKGIIKQQKATEYEKLEK